jgi:heme o synthase
MPYTPLALLDAPSPLVNTASMRDWWQLTKPRVVGLVAFTGWVGLMASPVFVHPLTALLIVLSIALGAAGAGVINMWFDRDIDPLMERTKTRPVASGRIHPDDALAFGWGLSLAGLMLMALVAGVWSMLFLGFSIVFYAVLYTMVLKRHTSQNIVIGGAAGAFPPMIGWLASGAPITLVPILLFLVIFLWTPAHFWALALLKQQDYANAGVPMLPNVKGASVTKLHILAYAGACMAVSVLLAFYVGWITTIVALIAGLWFVHGCNRLLLSSTLVLAGRTFGMSIVYLFLAFFAVLIDSIL